MLDLTIIICTYNPDPKIFSRCLNALSIALQSMTATEIIIVDNNSSIILYDQEYIKRFLEVHNQARIVQEKISGLTPARLRGIDEASSDLMVFIDDDNLIVPDFLSKGSEIAQKNPHIGAWSGQVLLEFEHEPEVWTRKYWGLLVYRRFNADYWSNLPHLVDTMPCGAGLFIRRQVAQYYNNLHKTGKRNIQLDRKGKSLFSGGDNDMAACACDIGMGVGLFYELIVTHYIPVFRTEKSYLLKLAEGIAASAIVFRSFRGECPSPLSRKNRAANYLRLALKNSIDRSFFKAVLKGEKTGRELLRRPDQ